MKPDNDIEKSMLYKEIEDDLNRYVHAVHAYRSELGKPDCSEGEKILYVSRINNYQSDIDEMMDVLEFMKERYRRLQNASIKCNDK